MTVSSYLGTVPVDPSPPPNCTVCCRFTLAGAIRSLLGTVRAFTLNRGCANSPRRGGILIAPGGAQRNPGAAATTIQTRSLKRGQSLSMTSCWPLYWPLSGTIRVGDVFPGFRGLRPLHPGLAVFGPFQGPFLLPLASPELHGLSPLHPGRRYSVPFRDHPRFDAQPWLRQFAPKGRNIDSPGWSAAQPGGSGHDNTNTVPEKGPISLYDIVLASLLAPFRDHPCWRRVPRVPRPAAASPGASSIRSLSGTVPITPRLPRIARSVAASPGASSIRSLSGTVSMHRYGFFKRG